MTTIAQVVKTIVENSINRDYIAECGNPITGAATLASIYDAEYGHHGKPTPERCRDYLQGLPSVCTVPFMNADILAILEAEGITKKTEKGQSGLVDLYWLEAGNQFWHLIK